MADAVLMKRLLIIFVVAATTFALVFFLLGVLRGLEDKATVEQIRKDVATFNKMGGSK